MWCCNLWHRVHSAMMFFSSKLPPSAKSMMCAHSNVCPSGKLCLLIPQKQHRVMLFLSKKPLQSFWDAGLLVSFPSTGTQLNFLQLGQVPPSWVDKFGFTLRFSSGCGLLQPENLQIFGIMDRTAYKIEHVHCLGKNGFYPNSTNGLQRIGQPVQKNMLYIYYVCVCVCVCACVYICC